MSNKKTTNNDKSQPVSLEFNASDIVECLRDCATRTDINHIKDKIDNLNREIQILKQRYR